MSATLLDVAAVRARFSVLDRPLAFFDGPGGTQCPDEVIDAIARYLREDNANIGAAYETSRRTDALVAAAHERGASFLGCNPGEVAFGQSMTALNFLLTRALARELESGDEVLVTRLDHDANVAPWLALAEDVGIVVRFVDVQDDLSLDMDDLAAKLSQRTRVVALPAAANSVGTAPDVARIESRARRGRARLGRRSPLRPARQDRRLGVGLRRAHLLAVQVLRAAHGRRIRERGGAAQLAAVQVRPASDEPVGHRFELGTSQHELLAGFVAAVDYIESLGWDAVVEYERSLGERFLDSLPGHVVLHGLPTMQGRVPTFCFSIPGRTAESVATHLASRDVAVWWGNYYALETVRRLGLDEVDGAVRAGIVHYNTAEEVDRLLAGLAELV